MKRYKSLLSLKWVAALLLVVGFVSCADEEIIDSSNRVVEGVMTDVNFSFTSPTPAKVESRAAIPTLDEYKVHNLYVYVFDKAGKNGELFKFDYDQLKDKKEKESESEGQTTSGKVSLRLSSGEKRIYAVANVDDQAPITEPTMAWDNIKTVKQLKENIISLKQEAIFRTSGKLLMGGVFESTSQNEQPEGYCNINPQVNSYSTIKLVRVDARITFNISLSNSSGTKIFAPRKWKVMNIPKKVYLFRNEGQRASDNADDYWDMPHTYNFESTSGGVSTFTFYAMENSYTTNGLGNYSDREKENKQADGSNYENPSFKNAPENSTYVILTGDYYEKYTENGHTKERRADVTYAIHLGYVDSDPNNFECNRNTTYTYNVYVEGVDKIRLEVTSYNEGGETKEDQPGAEGNIVETDKFYLFDSHYDRARIIFNKNQISGKAGFVLNTPFDNNFYYIENIENPDDAGMINALPSNQAKDYKWVSFRRNEKAKWGNSYIKDEFQPYDSEETLNVIELLKELHHGKVTGSNTDLFDRNDEVVYTVFINENYYDEDPRNESNTNFSWKDFVNQENREMHILCNTQRSEDRESSLTTSSIMISQRSIKTFYNEKAGSDLKTAWGIESVNETGWLIPPKSNPWNSSERTADNGRWNFFKQMPTIREASSGNPLWSNYISNAYVVDDNGVHNYLSSNSSRDKLVYACLQRNRDENGNGRIDAAEVKWYPAAINQLTDIWMGKDALPSEAHLYQNGDVKYRRYLSSDGQELYAEEGSSIGGYKFTYANSLPGSISAPTRYDYRCVRNLGMSEGVPAKTTIPQPYVQHDERGKMFTLTYMASVSVRGVGDFATDELANHTELDLTNRPYLKFEYKDAENISLTWEQVNRLVDQHKSPCAKYNTGGQIGWRLPNQRELSIMAAWCDNTGWGGSTHCQTRTGASPFMTGKGSTSGHSGGYHFMTLPSGGFKGPVRCVRDVK